MTRRVSIPIAATFSLLSACVDEPPLVDDVPDGGAGAFYSNPLDSSAHRWPNAEIPYRYEGDWTGDEQRVVITEMHEWQDLTRVTFTRVNDCSNCLVITDQGSSCNTSDLGTDGGTTMHLPDVDNCVTSAVVMHELGHAIGLAHEQKRGDRDNYVTFHPENTNDDGQFSIDTTSVEPVGHFDFHSVMNYRAFAHTSNGRMTLTRKDSWGLFDEDDKREWRTQVSTPVTELRVGDFDGIAGDDVVRRPSSGGFELSASAQGAWTPLHASDAPIEQVRVGQFDADPRADLVRASGTSWRYSSAGEGPWTTLLAASTTFDTMRVVDFDGDGDSDFVRISNNRFQVALDGRTAFHDQPTVFNETTTIDDVLFGDFVGDAHVDALRVDRNAFGIGIGLEVSDGLEGTFVPFRSGAIQAIQSLRAFDVDGRGHLDLVRIGSNPDPDEISYELALDGTGAWTEFTTAGVEELAKVAFGNFAPARDGQEILVNGYYQARDSAPTRTDRGGVAHIYYSQLLLSAYAHSNWEYWDDAPIDANIARYKVGDFDGDGLDDLFDVSTNAFTGITSTRFRRMNPDLSHADTGWHTLTFDVGPAANVAIGQFYGDARMDTFRKNGNWWEIQDGGVGPWMPMMYDTSTTVAQMVFADFDGNGTTDIFKSSSGWKISWDGRTQFEPLAGGLGTSLSLLRFGDFTGDGKADVVSWFSNAWWIWSQGSTTWTKLRDETSDIRNLRFGYIDSDNKLDVFRINGTAWQISSGATGNWTSTASGWILSSSALPSSALAIGRFSRTSGLRQDILGFVPALGDDNLNGW